MYGAACSSPSTGFPLCSVEVADYQQTANAGGTDGFIFRLNPTFQLSWSTFYGGIGDDHIYDATYMPSSPTQDGPTDRIAFVGSSTNAVPFGTTGTFQIVTNTSENGFISTFDSDGRPQWGTMIHGLMRLEAVISDKVNLIVMGVTDDAATTELTCDEVVNGIPICTIGSAYSDEVIHRRDAFFAEFNMPTGALKWSTVYGDLGWMGAEFLDENGGADNYKIEQQHPFPIYRFSDLEADPLGNLFAMGLFDNKKWNEYDDFQSTYYGYGLYNQENNSETGGYQTDLILLLFDRDRRLQWSSLFGGGFDHVTPNFDGQWVLKGCEFGHDLVLVPGEALYWVGTAGGVAFPEACPFEDVSWCEASLDAVGNNLDPLQGFATRMDLRGINVGIGERTSRTGALFSASPNPTDGTVVFRSGNTPLANSMVQITNALGQVVFLGQLDGQGAFNAIHLTSGSYAAQATTKEGDVSTVRFVRQ